MYKTKKKQNQFIVLDQLDNVQSSELLNLIIQTEMNKLTR